MLVDHLAVLPDVRLHVSVLRDKVRNMFCQPCIDFILSLAPVSVLGFILTVSHDHDREIVVFIDPRFVEYYLVSIFEANGLGIPVVLVFF